MMTLDSKDEECRSLLRNDTIAAQLKRVCPETRLNRCKRCLAEADSVKAKEKETPAAPRLYLWINMGLTISIISMSLCACFVNWSRYSCEIFSSVCVLGLTVITYCPISEWHRNIAHQLFRDTHTSLFLVRNPIGLRIEDSKPKLGWLARMALVVYSLLTVHTIWRNWLDPSEARHLHSQKSLHHLQMFGSFALTLCLGFSNKRHAPPSGGLFSLLPSLVGGWDIIVVSWIVSIQAAPTAISVWEHNASLPTSLENLDKGLSEVLGLEFGAISLGVAFAVLMPKLRDHLLNTV